TLRPRTTAALIAALASPLAWSQQTLPTVTVHGDVDPAGIGLAQSGSTASRLGLSGADTPASVESLSGATIAARGDLQFKDAITRTTGLTDISSPGNGIAYSARGFTENNSVAVLENGVRLLVGAGTTTYPSDPWGYERIEVLRGPGSVVHGSGTTGATINAVRKTPRRESSVEALAGIGGGAALRAGVGATGALGERSAYRIDAYASRSDGFIDRGEARSGKVLSSLRWTPSASVEVDFQLDHAQQQPIRYFGTPLNAGRIDAALRERNYDVADAVIEYVDDKAVARLQWRVSPQLTVSDELAYLKARRHWRNAESYLYDPAGGTVERSDYIEIRHRQEQTGNRLEARWDGGANRIVAGWEAALINFTHINNSPYGGSSTVKATGFDPGVFASPDPTRPNFKTDTTTHAVYLEDAFSLGEQAVLLAGVRHDRYRVGRTSLLGAAGFDTTLSATAVRLGATWHVAPGASLYAQASTGSDPVASILSLNLASSRFDLTRARQLEAGFKQSVADGAAEWSAAVYRIRKDDIITRDPANPALSIQGGAQSSRGVELSGSASLAAHWRLDANAAWTDAQYDTLFEGGNVSRAGKRPPNVPAASANLWLGYRAGSGRAGAGARYVGKRFADNANAIALPGYTTLDASFAYALTPNLQLQLNVRNLGDRVYATTAYTDNQVLLGEQRHAELTLQAKF
ncbi:MAG: TonB-dependent receptor, partial [Gammaproteobacteria bacterium]